MNIKIDLFKDTARLARTQLNNAEGIAGSIPEDDTEVLSLYARRVRYSIAPQPREVLKAKEFNSSGHVQGLTQLIRAIRHGASLIPYMAKGITDLSFHDPLMDHWNVRHFHLGTKWNRDGFIERTREVAFAAVDDNAVYLIKIFPHQMEPWYKQELVQIIHDNWPELLADAQVPSVDSLEHNLTDENVKQLRNAHVATFLQMTDGTVYIEPGVGTFSDGSQWNDVRWVDQQRRYARYVQNFILTNHEQLREYAWQLGHPYGENVEYTLREWTNEQMTISENSSGIYLTIPTSDDQPLDRMTISAKEPCLQNIMG